MPNASDIQWFKQQFQAIIETAISATPFDVDLIVAIACQETGHIWSVLRKKPLTIDQILALCVGDTLDADKGRRAFPKTKADLLKAPGGQDMFDIARAALVEMAKHIPGFRGAVNNPNKFCHGFGVFQRDLQFFLSDPDYFLERRYEKFSETLAQCLAELDRALTKNGLRGKPVLTDLEMAGVAITYNTGRFKPAKGLKQGHFDGTRFYGEAIFDFLRLSRTVAGPGLVASIPAPVPGNAALPPPSPIEADGAVFAVSTRAASLRMRSNPSKSRPLSANVIVDLPDGHLVRAVKAKRKKGFIEVETSLNGGHFRGFVATEFLSSAPRATSIPIVTAADTPPASGIVAVHAPRKSGAITKRSAIATALCLNESGQPGRSGDTAEKLRAELAAIIDWLAVDKASHKRYQPRDGLTFCNIYAHDYCHLAGAYLPRVWWTQKAIEALAQGKEVEPLLGDTIREVRANGLYDWLTDFGPRFGWRRTGTLTKLQQEVNQGAIGLISARRKSEGPPGHIAAVVPETEDHRARRDSTGEVIAPLQSQAGATNFSYGTGKLNWWRAEQFAESGFWLHS
jgi:hypothetical protein